METVPTARDYAMHLRVTIMLIYFIILCCLPIFGLVTAVVVLARTTPRLDYSLA